MSIDLLPSLTSPLCFVVLLVVVVVVVVVVRVCNRSKFDAHSAFPSSAEPSYLYSAWPRPYPAVSCL
jgi:hypothetical protein